MKKKSILLITLIIVMLLTACESKQEKELNTVQELINEGKYELAKEALLKSEIYRDIQSKMEEIKSNTIETLSGEWVSLNSEKILEFSDDRTVDFYTNGELHHSEKYIMNGGVINIGSTNYIYEEKEGIAYLSYDDGDKLKPIFMECDNEFIEEIDITLDNWDNYFEEVHGLHYPVKDDFGDYERVYFGAGIALKEELVDRFIQTSASFKCDVDNYYCDYEISDDAKSYSLKEATFSYESPKQILSYVYDLRNDSKYENTDYENMILVSSQNIYDCSEDRVKKVISVKGKLLLRK